MNTMPSCEFIKAGLLTTIQDAGRKGLMFYALPNSGPMDKKAARLANTIVGNAADAATIECNLTAPSIKFHESAIVAVTGADMCWTVNHKPIRIYSTIRVGPNDILSGTSAQNGLRSYIAIKGKIISARHYGSSSSYSYAKLGFNQGQGIKKGQLLKWKVSNTPMVDLSMTALEYSRTIPCCYGPEYKLLSSESKKRLHDSSFYIQPDSNRMGARLKGLQLKTTEQLLESVCVLPGFIQLPPSGQPIVILRDGQTTGGYPRIAYLKEEALDQFNQIPFNQAFNFSF